MHACAVVTPAFPQSNAVHSVLSCVSLVLHYLSLLAFDYIFFTQDKLRVLFMRSDGGLTPMNLFTGSQAILSGPAGGVVNLRNFRFLS